MVCDRDKRTGNGLDILIYDLFFLTHPVQMNLLTFIMNWKMTFRLEVFVLTYRETDFTSRHWTFIERPLALLFVFGIELQGYPYIIVCWIRCHCVGLVVVEVCTDTVTARSSGAVGGISLRINYVQIIRCANIDRSIHFTQIRYFR